MLKPKKSKYFLELDKTIDDSNFAGFSRKKRYFFVSLDVYLSLYNEKPKKRLDNSLYSKPHSKEDIRLSGSPITKPKKENADIAEGYELSFDLLYRNIPVLLWQNCYTHENNKIDLLILN